MTQNRRIALNIVATYGRSLYVMVVGLFAARWVLKALGQVDYGLVGLVGGLAMFVSFLNALLAAAVGRFYAVEVGAANKTGNESEGLEDCRRWFNTALSLHLVVSVVLVAIGYPIGAWAVENFLTIPPDRMSDCIWVWRFTCLSCFVNMFCVPFQAMYTAKQEIAELTVYGFATTTLNAFFFYYISTHSGVWLTPYSAWICAMSVLPELIIAVRAFIKYEECRFNVRYLWSANRLKALLYYAVARFWANFSGMVGAQGQSILVNKYMGPVYNASMTVGNAVAGHAVSFSSALSAAFWPAIANKAGEEDADSVRRLSFFTCRIGAALVLVFAIPLGLEVDEVLRIWLVNPPPFASGICLIVLIRMVFEKMTEGYELAIYGTGNGVMKYSWSAGWAGICTALVAWICFAMGLKMWSIVIGLAVSKCMTCVIRLWLGRSLVGFSFRYWVRSVFVPLFFLSVTVSVGGSVIRILLCSSLFRVVATALTCVLIFLPSIWLVVFDEMEKTALKNKFSLFCRRCI